MTETSLSCKDSKNFAAQLVQYKQAFTQQIKGHCDIATMNRNPMFPAVPPGSPEIRWRNAESQAVVELIAFARRDNAALPAINIVADIVSIRQRVITIVAG
jgi:hypothetical protein